MPRLQLVFEKQWLHLLLLAILLMGVTWVTQLDHMNIGMFLGIQTPEWFWFAIWIPIAHQIFIWFCWRTQLHGKLITRIFGKLGFPVYALIFSFFGISRFVAILALSISNRDTLVMEILVLRIFAIIITIPALYLLYSVICYFSFKRAMGLDHFDETYRRKPLVQKGIFRFTRNGMYIIGFLFLWIPALWYGSVAALCAALFNHLYIWVHYFSTELPDMKHIYGETSLNTGD